MYFDANQLSPDAEVSGYDICIVGAGAAGIAQENRRLRFAKPHRAKRKRGALASPILSFP